MVVVAAVRVVVAAAALTAPCLRAQLFKAAAQSWCPSPEGYPKHCCYAEALKEMDGGREVDPHRYLLQIFPDTPVFK